MGTATSIGAGLGLSLAAFAAAAAAKGPGKAPPACSAINFHALAGGMTDGDHESGMYGSRCGRLELHGEGKQGAAGHYFVFAGGKRVAAASGNLPEAVVG